MMYAAKLFLMALTSASLLSSVAAAELELMREMFPAGPRTFFVDPRLAEAANEALVEFDRSFHYAGLQAFHTEVAPADYKGSWANGRSEIMMEDKYDMRFIKKSSNVWWGAALGRSSEADIIVRYIATPADYFLIILHEILHTFGLGHSKEGLMMPRWPVPFSLEWPLIDGLSDEERGFLADQYGFYVSGDYLIYQTNKLY